MAFWNKRKPTPPQRPTQSTASTDIPQIPTIPATLSDIVGILTAPPDSLTLEAAMQRPSYLSTQATGNIGTYYVFYSNILAGRELFARVRGTFPSLTFEDLGPATAVRVSVDNTPSYWANMLASDDTSILHLWPAPEYLRERIMAGNVRLGDRSLGDTSRYQADGYSGFIVSKVEPIWDSTDTICTGAWIPSDLGVDLWARQLQFARDEWFSPERAY